ncbi:hypothetical protein [Fibrella aquatica]|uniref:hypothetical protein n=1 Tax=Fibrella aquatica TaxID=3242487 RepID=UPI00351FF79E
MLRQCSNEVDRFNFQVRPQLSYVVNRRLNVNFFLRPHGQRPVGQQQLHPGHHLGRCAGTLQSG